jgi:hypothetical protein
MTNGSEVPAEWNGNPIPPRPPLPAVDSSHEPDTAPEPPKFKIGMPPGMDVHLDTVPSSDIAAPIPVAKPEFGPAPTPLDGVPATPPVLGLAPPVPPASVPEGASSAPATPAMPSVPASPAAPFASAPPAATSSTVASPGLASSAPPTASVSVRPATSPRLVLPDGAVLPLSAGLIVGRDPQHQDGYGVSALARLHDVERSVSKTHAVLGVSEGRVWIIDLNSTNGTFMVAPDGTLTPCPPEVATELDPGADIRFGEYRVRVALD